MGNFKYYIFKKDCGALVKILATYEEAQHYVKIKNGFKRNDYLIIRVQGGKEMTLKTLMRIIHSMETQGYNVQDMTFSEFEKFVVNNFEGDK